MSRMTLDSLVTGVQNLPLRVAVYGVEGIGKSTFAAQAPAPIFISTEAGTGHLNVARFPEPTCFAEVWQALQTLHEQDHQFQTVVVDSLDWAERLAQAEVCDELGVKSLAEVDYGKGFALAHERFKYMFTWLSALWQHRRMNVILVAHTDIRPFRSPDSESYDRYVMRLDKRNEPMVREWVDVLLFCNYDLAVRKEGKGFNARAVGKSLGLRIAHTQRGATFDAKARSRHGFAPIPPEIDLSWDALAEKYNTPAGQAAIEQAAVPA